MKRVGCWTDFTTLGRRLPLNTTRPELPSTPPPIAGDKSPVSLSDLHGDSISPRPFPQPSIEINLNLVTDNLDRENGKPIMELCPQIQNPAPVPSSPRTAEQVLLTPYFLISWPQAPSNQYFASRRAYPRA